MKIPLGPFAKRVDLATLYISEEIMHLSLFERTKTFLQRVNVLRMLFLS